MSFDFGPVNKLTGVQASSKTSDGGAGNTGYFAQGRREEEEVQVGFAKDYPSDCFEKADSISESENESILSLLKNIFFDIFDLIKSFFVK